MTTSTEYEQRYNGLLYSLMSWQQLADFWAGIDRSAGWYIAAAGESAPDAPASAEQVERFIVTIDELLHREHRESYCGIVYADDHRNPSLIKIYDPNHLGAACGSSKEPTQPGWVMSRLRPTPITPKWVVPATRKRWWNALFS